MNVEPYAPQPGEKLLRYVGRIGHVEEMAPVYENMTPIAQAVALPRHLAMLQRQHVERRRVYEAALLAALEAYLPPAEKGSDPSSEEVKGPSEGRGFVYT